MLCVYILYISILTHAPPSPPFLTFGARHSHGCGRLYACSPPGGTQCPPFTVLVLVLSLNISPQEVKPDVFGISDTVVKSKLEQLFQVQELSGLNENIEGRTVVTPEDIFRVAPLCLRHRLRKDPLESIDSGDKVRDVFKKVFGYA